MKSENYGARDDESLESTNLLIAAEDGDGEKPAPTTSAVKMVFKGTCANIY
jgi:hypothetical protein